ncbi:hypothetical protein [Flavobacterium olei]|uniref:hypothetical protein n=1 Tax=Flavobacterium olei TaxID=1886782 RepID=UPI00321A7FEC
MMNNEYPLEWLDSLVLKYFNPAKTDVTKLTEADLAEIEKNGVLEIARIQVRIKNEIFALKRKRQIRLLVRKYHTTLIFLMDNMVEICKNGTFKVPRLSRTADNIIRYLDELLSFLENRYAAYLSLDEKVPLSYLLVSRKELQLKLKKLQNRNPKMKESNERQVFKLVTEELTQALLLLNRSRITFRQLLYQRSVLKELEEMDDYCESTLFSFLDCKLIGLNFNSKKYIDLLLKGLAEKLLTAESITEKLSLLSYFFKEFRQVKSNSGMFLNSDVQSIVEIVDNWIQSEIKYYERLLELSASGDTNIGSIAENKVECDLSADQIGIILRAADEARIVKARSMSLVFQRIVPHLSTGFKKQLSYQSVRSKSYNAEESDKDIAILTLEKMIKKIKSY